MGGRSLDRDGLGTLAEGTQADLTIFDAPSHVHVPYSYGVNRVDTMLKTVKPVVRGGERRE